MVFFKSFHQLIWPCFVSWITSTNAPENISDATYVIDKRFYPTKLICSDNKSQNSILTYHTFMWVVYSQSFLNKHCSLQYASFASSSNNRFRSIIQSPPSKNIDALVERTLSGIEKIYMYDIYGIIYAIKKSIEWRLFLPSADIEPRFWPNPPFVHMYPSLRFFSRHRW